MTAEVFLFPFNPFIQRSGLGRVPDVPKLPESCGRLCPAAGQGEWVPLPQKLNSREGFPKTEADLSLLKPLMGTSICLGTPRLTYVGRLNSLRPL